MIIIQLLLTALAVYISARFTPGVHIASYWSAIVVALVMTLLNIFVKPILTFISLPITLLTMGLFLLIINAIIILIASYLVGSFHVDGFGSAILFSVVFTIISWLLKVLLG